MAGMITITSVTTRIHLNVFLSRLSSLCKLPQRDMRPLWSMNDKCSHRWWHQTSTKPNQSDTYWRAENEVKTYWNRKCSGGEAVVQSVWAGESEISSVDAVLLFYSSRIFSRCLMHSVTWPWCTSYLHTLPHSTYSGMKDRRQMKEEERGRDERSEENGRGEDKREEEQWGEEGKKRRDE